MGEGYQAGDLGGKVVQFKARFCTFLSLFGQLERLTDGVIFTLHFHSKGLRGRLGAICSIFGHLALFGGV